MKLCEYTSADEKDCLAIFDSNMPLYFAPQERETFQRFLNKLAAPYFYFVVRDEMEKIVGCGGTKLDLSNGQAWLRWGMVAREFHKRRIGTFLTLSRMYRACQIPEIQTIWMGTGQDSYRFYEKIGFVTQRMLPNGIVPGIDEYLMELKLDDGKRQELESLSKRAFLI